VGCSEFGAKAGPARKWGRGGRGPGANPGVPGPPPALSPNLGRQPPARRSGRGASPVPRCRTPVGATGHRIQSGPGAKLDPPEHNQPIPAPPWTQGAYGGQYSVQLAWLITQPLLPRAAALSTLPLLDLGQGTTTSRPCTRVAQATRFVVQLAINAVV
jgi:hypothetical protein